jgi:hypothetical protein
MGKLMIPLPVIACLLLVLAIMLVIYYIDEDQD